MGPAVRDKAQMQPSSLTPESHVDLICGDGDFRSPIEQPEGKAIGLCMGHGRQAENGKQNCADDRVPYRGPPTLSGAPVFLRQVCRFSVLGWGESPIFNPDFDHGDLIRRKQRCTQWHDQALIIGQIAIDLVDKKARANVFGRNKQKAPRGGGSIGGDDVDQRIVRLGFGQGEAAGAGTGGVARRRNTAGRENFGLNSSIFSPRTVLRVRTVTGASGKATGDKQGETSADDCSGNRHFVVFLLWIAPDLGSLAPQVSIIPLFYNVNGVSLPTSGCCSRVGAGVCVPF